MNDQENQKQTSMRPVILIAVGLLADIRRRYRCRGRVRGSGGVDAAIRGVFQPRLPEYAKAGEICSGHHARRQPQRAAEQMVLLLKSTKEPNVGMTESLRNYGVTPEQLRDDRTAD